MVLARNLFFVLFLSTTVAIMLSFLPTNHSTVDFRLTEAVFQPTKPIHLQQSNLVDLVANFVVEHELTHVEWQNQNLFVDFQVDLDEPIVVEQIYEDLYNTLSNVYLRTSNVKSLYIRFHYEKSGNKEVLIALSSDKSAELQEVLTQPRKMEKEEFLKKHTRISYGVLWVNNNG
jgi:hypothetical protein